MSKSIQAIRGMNDILPEHTSQWQHVEGILHRVLSRYHYQEIRLPIVEYTDLFKRSIGEVTDIVEKEMYTFEDRNGESLTLRPEGTAGCVRAGNQHGLLYNQQQRLWYTGPMFRYERPQKGRYRQFHQLGVEAFGFDSPDIDAELILLSARLWKELGLSEYVQLELNSLASNEARGHYREALVAYLGQHEGLLDEDSKRRLHTNPLRILDSKNPALAEVLASAPRLSEYWDSDSRAHFERLCQHLDAAGIAYTLNERLVRGLDYYNRTVFEWTTTHLGAQGTVCAGGRYDGLVEQLGGKSTPAVGFAIGLERLMLMLETAGKLPAASYPHIYITAAGDIAELPAQCVAERLRDEFPHLQVQLHCGGGQLGRQLKRADRSGAKVALVLGEQEVANQQYGLKYLRDDREQELVDWPTLVTRVAAINFSE